MTVDGGVVADSNSKWSGSKNPFRGSTVIGLAPVLVMTASKITFSPDRTGDGVTRVNVTVMGPGVGGGPGNPPRTRGR